jgi:hypothetical protein
MTAAFTWSRPGQSFERGATVIFDPIGRFLFGVFAIALAAACVAAAATERPPAARVSRTAIAIAALWVAGFVAAATYALVGPGQFAIFGLLVAAAEVVLAGVIWALRASPRDSGEDDGGGDDDDDGPRVPPEYWARWEASLETARVPRRRLTRS